MALKLKKGFSWTVLLVLIVAGVVIQQGVVFGVTAPDKSSLINLQADTIALSGFMADENLITSTNTLLRPYTNDASADFITNKDAVTNNNWCERTNDSVDPDPDAISHSELTGLWVTFDTNYLYVAVRGQAMGRHNNILAMLDSNVNYGANDFTLITHNHAWKRDILFDEGIVPNIYLGFWCADNTANYNATDAGGNTKMFYGDGYGSDWTESSSQCSNQNSLEGEYYSWYNGSTQTERTKRLWMFKVAWSVITNSQFAVDMANLEIRLAFATTGPDDKGAMYDYMPETQYQIVSGATSTMENNYFIVPVTDSAGNLLTGGIEMNTNASVYFMPGTKWDVANDPFPMNMYDSAGNAVKAFSPNDDTYNDSIKFSIALNNRGLLRTTFKIYDLKGRLIRTLFSGLMIPCPVAITYNGIAGDVNPVENSDLQWDGKDDSGNNVPMGIYIIVFTGLDGSVPVMIKKSVSVIR